MRKRCVEINKVFYETINHAKKATGEYWEGIEKKCLSDEFSNYKFVPFRITYTEKICNTCGKEKPVGEFYFRKDNKKYRGECKECTKINSGKRYLDNSEEINEQRKEQYKKDPEPAKAYSQKYREEHPEEVRASIKKWRGENKNYINKKQRLGRQNDPVIRLIHNMSVNIRNSLKGNKNGRHWETLVGYTQEELRTRLESLFTEGMSWDNYGYGDDKWVIDHIIAICYWNITSNTCQELRDCWALKNLQPLWKIRNAEKRDKPMHPKYLIKPDCIK